MHLFRSILLLVLALFAAPAAAAGATHLAVSLHSESESPAPGRSTRLALKFVPQPGWHGYWSNPGDSGLPPNVSWKAPPGIRFGPLRHPAPSLLEVAGMASFVHAGTHVLLTEMSVPAGLEPGTELPVQARLEWLACTDTLCVPERATVELRLTVGDGRAAQSNTALFRSAAAALPRTVGKAGQFHLAGGRLVLSLPAGAVLNPERARFFPDESGAFDATRQSARRSDDGIEIALAGAGELPPRLNGVVSDGSRSYRVRFERAEAPPLSDTTPQATAAQAENPLTAAAAGKSVDALERTPIRAQALESGTAGFLAALAGALVGGILLNLMPCVFPVLSLKALSLARSGGASAAEARLEAVAYTLGTTAVCLALGAALLALKAAGAELGWSFQLQSPTVILLLLVLSSAIAANLAGLFEVRGPSFRGAPAAGGAVNSFSTGALAAFIATPCSAPFMASALGAALLLPPAQGLAVFAGLGIGLGLPFVAIGFVPAIRDRLPRPGPWMATLRKALAVPMALTAVWLLWVLGRQSGADVMALALVLALGTVAALWWVGRRQDLDKRIAWAPLAPVAAALAVAAVTLPALGASASASVSAPAPGASDSEPFSVRRLAELRAQGTPVFVDFTADWCLACKVNDKIAIDRRSTQDAFRKAGVVTLVGDWTRGDPQITRFLAAHDRNSIPFYLFYAPGREPQVLPQVLTPGLLQGLAEKSRARRVEAAGPQRKETRT